MNEFLEKLRSYYKTIWILSLIVSVILSDLVSAFYDFGLLLNVILTVLAALVCHEIIMQVSYAIISDIVSRKRAEQDISINSTQQNFVETILVIDHPEQPAGKFKNTIFYDWIVFQFEDDTIIKYKFAGTSEIDYGVHIFKDDNAEIILSPGIIYRKIDDTEEI